MESHGHDATGSGGDDPWDQLSGRLKALADRLRTAYREASPGEGPDEDQVREAISTLVRAWDRVSTSMAAALADGDTREELRKTIGSLSAALATTLSRLGEADEAPLVPPLIGVTELAARLQELKLQELKLYDIRWSLLDPTKGEADYREGHIPGAVFVDLERDLCGPSGEGRHPLPDPARFAATLRRLGLSREDPVVVYDDAGGAVAARMWWMLCSIGHREVRLLDGGLQAWVAAGLPLEGGDHRPEPGDYPDRIRFSGVVDHSGLEGRPLVDVRAPERYRGEHEPIDSKAGHIPGAINLPYSDNLDPSGLFRPPSDLEEHYRELPQGAVLYCGSGVNACHTALAITLAGMPTPDVYIGSFSDWSRRDLPVGTGPEP